MVLGKVRCGGGKTPTKRVGLGEKPCSLGNFCSYMAYVPPPKTPHSQRVPLGCVVISVTLILLTQNPRFPPVVPLACSGVIRVFLIILLILEHKIKWFLLIFWILSEKTDADLFPRFTN